TGWGRRSPTAPSSSAPGDGRRFPSTCGSSASCGSTTASGSRDRNCRPGPDATSAGTRATPSNTSFISRGRRFNSAAAAMSESQKMIASLSGAFIAHALLLLFAALMLRASPRGAAHRGFSVAGPREVTISVSDLMERIELEEAVPAAALAPEFRPSVTTELYVPYDSSQ